MDILDAAMDKLSDRIERIESLMDEGMGGCPCCSSAVRLVYCRTLSSEY